MAKCSEWDAVTKFYGQYGVYPSAVHISGVSANSSFASATPFEGYKLGDAVVSPITGKIVDIGTTEITNEEINGEEKVYNVDYIKIQALSEKDLALLKDELEKNTHEYDSYSYTDYQAYEDFYEEYKGVCEDYVITIKGLKNITLTESEVDALMQGEEGSENATTNVTIQNAEIKEIIKVETDVMIDEEEAETEEGEVGEETSESLEGTQKDFKINNYTRKQTPNLVKDSDEEEFEALENAKFDAKCLITVNDPEEGKDVTYIKAGTLIGYATDANIKLLLRDDKNAIVENVEDYIEIDETVASIQELTTFSAQIEAAKAMGIPVGEMNASEEAMRQKIIDNYFDIIQKYSSEYGLDPYLVVAMICGESSGDPTSDNGCAIGLMQWEYAANGTSITVTKADGTEETITGITKSALANDVDFQIKAGCAELKNKLDACSGNVFVALQGYNFGEAGVRRTIGYYMATSGNYGISTNTSTSWCGATTEQIDNYIDSGDVGWMESNAREWYSKEGCNYFNAGSGTPDYVERILRFYSTES